MLKMEAADVNEAFVDVDPAQVEDDDIETAVVLTIYEYTNLLHDELLRSDDLWRKFRGPSLMTACFDIALFVAAPNEAIAHFDAKEQQRIVDIVREYIFENIAQLIVSFVPMRDGEYLKWTKEESKSTNAWFRSAGPMLDQVHFSCNEHIVDFRNMRSDFVNIRTPLLDMNAEYFINMYLLHKGEEMTLGLFERDSYSTTAFPVRCRDAILYYGGDNRSGSRPTGKIWVNGQTVRRTVNGYSTGDWITFHIDFPSGKMAYYKNGLKEHEFISKKELSKKFYFWVPVDVRKDTVFIEQAPSLCHKK